MHEDITPIEKEIIEGLEIEVKDHLEKDHGDSCAYCGQFFPPDEVVIEKTINGKKWTFCSDQCYYDFQESTNFKDEDLDGKDVVAPSSDEVYQDDVQRDDSE